MTGFGDTLFGESRTRAAPIARLAPAPICRPRADRPRMRPIDPATATAATTSAPPRDARGHWRRKPDWVRREVLRLAVFLPSCRRLADTFNAINGRRHTVSKTWVAELCRTHAAEIRLRRCRMRQTPPQAVAVGKRWSLDMSCVRLPGSDTPRLVLGIIDQGSRALLRLKQATRKCAWTLLGHLCLAIAEHGVPDAIRTDNEGMFQSRLWQTALRLMGIRRERGLQRWRPPGGAPSAKDVPDAERRGACGHADRT